MIRKLYNEDRFIPPCYKDCKGVEYDYESVDIKYIEWFENI
jgi:hypothetical protein